MKSALQRRIGAIASSLLIVSTLAVLPASSTAAARTPHQSATTCVANGTPQVNGVIALKFQGSSSTGCSATLHGQWAAHSSQFDTSYADFALAGSTGDWSSAIASPQLHGTVSGVVPAATGTGTSSGAAGSGTGTLGTGTLGTNAPVGSKTLGFTLDCVITYSPLHITCTLTIYLSSY